MTITSLSSDGSYIEAPTVSHIVDLLRVSWFFKLVEENRDIKWDLRKQGPIVFFFVFFRKLFSYHEMALSLINRAYKSWCCKF